MRRLSQRTGKDRRTLARKGRRRSSRSRRRNLGKAIRKLRAGLDASERRGPAGSRRLSKRSVRRWNPASIPQRLNKPNPGVTALHRLNRTEYANAIRDLIDVDVDVATMLPADDSSEGLDNIADVLGTSPALIERYIGAAAKISRLAIGDTDIGPSQRRIRFAAI